MEFIVNTDLDAALPKTIDFNFEALKAELAERLSYYNGLVVTEDTIKEGKAEKAKLNKLREAVENKRKEIKRECMAPYTDFENKVKELVAMIDAPVAAIDRQLKEFEDRRREEKRREIEVLYERVVPADIRTIAPLERIFDPKWLNATVRLNDVEMDIEAMASRINDDLIVLETVEPEFAVAVRARYMETLKIGEALRHKKLLQEAAERQPKAEEPRTMVYAAEEKPPAVQPPVEKVYCLRLEMRLTQAQATALKRFLNDNAIRYEKI